jgi:hypothetical protein
MAESRNFIRHNVDVPLEVTSMSVAGPQHGVNLSHGGLSFEASTCLTDGEIIQLRIPTVEPPFEALARVVWCRPEGEGFLVGAAFLDSTDAFQSRMVEQVCAIEGYRKMIAETEGRTLNAQEAAAEWIEKFAGRFPT